MANDNEKTVQQVKELIQKGGNAKEESEQTKKLGQINKSLKEQDGHATDMAKLIESQTNLLNSISNSLGQQTSIAEQQAVDDKLMRENRHSSMTISKPERQSRVTFGGPRKE